MSCSHLNPSNYTETCVGRYIYKEECTKCFASSRSTEGIDVCLKCFNGGCAEEHSSDHFQNTSHPLAVNIKLITPKSQDPASLSKISIKSSEEHPIAELKCLNCKLTLNPDQKTASLIDSILLTNSALFQSSVDQWENELTPCEHTLTLAQNGSVIAEKSLAKCAACDLNSNLWLCMTCGHLGCGRKTFDGTGGNSHALFHSKKTTHPLVCKLGTISPEGSASIHCYKCDLEVIDQDLQAHLLTFGIQIQKLQKTEKTITELELETDINLTLSKVLEDGKVLSPRYGPMFTGMENLGNSCYLNSVMQCLFAVPEWLSRFNRTSWLDTQDPANNFYCQMAKLAIGLSSGKYSTQKWTEITENDSDKFLKPQEYQDGIRPMMFKALIGKGHPEFSTARQQDAFEFFQHVLALTEKLEKEVGGSPSSVFEFVMRSKVKCTECNRVRYTDQKQNSITTSLEIDPEEDRTDLLVPWDFLFKSFYDDFLFELQCSGCKKITPGCKKIYFNTLPRVLVVQVNRFVCTDWVPKKLECGVDVPAESCLSQFKFTDEGEELLPEESSKKDPEISQLYLSQLLDLGIPETQAKNALIKTNNASVENAASWVFENLENPELIAPIQKETDPLVRSLTELGFTEPQVRHALSKCDGSAERALDYLFSHPREMDIEEVGVNREDGKYKLFGVITHLGASVHSGHYVAHLLKGEEWVLFNDGKVAATTDPPLSKGYIYFFRLLES